MQGKRIHWYQTLSAKLILSLAVVSIAVMAVYTYVLFSTHRSHLMKEVVRGATQFSETVKRITYHDMLVDKRDNVYRIMETIGEQAGIEKVRVFNPEGRIMFSTDKAEQGGLVDKKAEACYACHSIEKPIEKLGTGERSRIFTSKDSTRTLGMITPVYNEKSCYTAPCHFHPESQKVLGVIDIGMSLDVIDREMSQTRRFMNVFTIGATLGMCILVGLFIQRHVNRPIRRLLSGTKRISEGTLDYRIDTDTRDEIGYLAESFNLMTQNLGRAHEEVQNLVRTLEVRVEKRTKELKDAQMLLIQSEKLASIGKLAAGIAHEINNPIGAILIYGHLLLEDLKKAHLTPDNADKIIRETERVRNIVNGLLEFARQREPEMKPADINIVIGKTLDMLSKQVLLQNITIHKTLHQSPLTVLGDASQIQQVFTNIIINAAEAMDGKGDLTIATRAVNNNGHAEIEFTDTGCGITAEDQTRLFEPFFTTKRNRGTGLGLAVSYGIISRHNGQIVVISEVNKGTTFTITLPLMEHGEHG